MSRKLTEHVFKKRIESSSFKIQLGLFRRLCLGESFQLGILILQKYLSERCKEVPLSQIWVGFQHTPSSVFLIASLKGPLRQHVIYCESHS